MNNETSTTAQITNISQLDKANVVLKGLATSVTTDDRKTAEKKLGISRYSIVIYLKGEGKSLDTAMSLIEFFQKRIEDRDKRLEGAA